MVIKIRTEIDIDANIDMVWDALMDYENWKLWSKWTHFEGIPQNAQDGTKGTLVIAYDGDEKYERFSFVLKETSKSKYFMNWTGNIPPNLFNGNHWIQLTETSPGKTHVEHSEDFSGILPYFRIGMPFDKVERNYGLINIGLKQYVENKK